MNPFDVATTIPDLPDGFVARENFNMTIDAMLAGDDQVVVVQGKDGFGKTTLLNSYTQSRQDRSIALFLKAVRLSFEPSGVIAELASQYRTLLGMKPRPNILEESGARSDLSALAQRLAERLRMGKRTMTIVVDGLADVCAKDRAAAQDILELLPFGRHSFRFLLSGAIDGLLRDVGCTWSPYRLSLFSVEETRQLFSGIDIDERSLIRIHSACNGIVGQLAAVRRLGPEQKQVVQQNLM